MLVAEKAAFCREVVSPVVGDVGKSLGIGNMASALAGVPTAGALYAAITTGGSVDLPGSGFLFLISLLSLGTAVPAARRSSAVRPAGTFSVHPFLRGVTDTNFYNPSRGTSWERAVTSGR